MLFPVLCGAIGFGTVGHIENAVTFSPAQLVMDNEIARYVRRAVRGFEVTEESIDVHMIREVGAGGSFMGHPETAARFREFLNLSSFFRAEPWGATSTPTEERRWERIATRRARELLRNDVPSPLSPEQAAGVDAVVAEAEARLREQGKL
jgi:trimethylamine:corrinoid methyltransferase-like protein